MIARRVRARAAPRSGPGHRAAVPAGRGAGSWLPRGPAGSSAASWGSRRRRWSELAAGLLRDFGGRHHDYRELLRRHALIVSAHVEETRQLTTARTPAAGRQLHGGVRDRGRGAVQPERGPAPQPGRPRAPGRPGWRSASGASGKGTSRRSASARPSSARAPSGLSSRGACRSPWPSRPRPGGAGSTCGPSWPARETSTSWPRPCCAPCRPTSTGTDLERVLAQAPPGLLTRPGSAATVDLLRTTVAAAYAPSSPPARPRPAGAGPGGRRGAQRHGGRPVHPVRGR